MKERLVVIESLKERLASVEALSARITAIEAMKAGANEQRVVQVESRNTQRADVGQILALAVAVIAVIGFVLGTR
jgi:hypothetical protein